MSSRLDKAIKDFIQIIREAGNKGTSPLDAQAEVLRIDEDGTAWVHLPGGVDETPVKLTINAEVGDKVYVRLSGGRAWITGNQTAPPTDDKTAVAAKSLANLAGNRAKTAQKIADQAQAGIDNLEVGGRNLLPFKTWCKNIQLTNYTELVEGRFSVNNTVGSNGSLFSTPFIFGEIGQKYTFSSKPYTQGTTKLRLDIGTYDGTTFTPKDNLGLGGSDGTFTKYLITRDDVNAVRVNYSTASKPIVLDQVKIEKGNKATDWTPAPEDVEAGIDNAAKVATNYIHSDSTNGLVVNNNQNVGVGYDIQLKADGSNTGMNIRQNGNILASFLQNSVSLGKNSINSKIGMCGDKGGVSASFGYYVDSVASNNGEPGSTLSFDFNETTFKNKVGQKTGFYDFIYTSADGWELFDYAQDTTSKVTLSQYGITMKTPTSSIKDNAGITINYVIDGSVKFYNADISNPVRKLELEMAENPSSSESDYANITIERQSGTYASGDGKEHSIITMMTLHEFANVATLQLFDDEISLNATRLYLTSSYGDGAIQLDGDTNINGNLIVQGDNLVSKIQNMFCTSYNETLTITAGTFTDNGCSATLVGNSLRLYISAKAKSAITAGNITNQTMLTITFTDDRILALYSASGSGGSSGPNSQMQFSTTNSGGQHTITVTLAAIAQNIASGGTISAHVSMPCVLNWDAY